MGTIVSLPTTLTHLLYFTSGTYQPSCPDISTVLNIWDQSPIFPVLWLVTKGNVTSHALKWGGSGSWISLIKVNKKHIGLYLDAHVLQYMHMGSVVSVCHALAREAWMDGKQRARGSKHSQGWARVRYQIVIKPRARGKKCSQGQAEIRYWGK